MDERGVTVRNCHHANGNLYLGWLSVASPPPDRGPEVTRMIDWSRHPMPTKT